MSIYKRAFIVLMLVSQLIILNGGLKAETQVPLFRYALDHWGTNPYRAIVFYDSEITEQQSSWLEDIRKLSIEGDNSLNIVLEYVDVGDTVPESLVNVIPLIAEGLKENNKIPQLAVMYPSESELTEPAWYGALTQNNVRNLIDSPARQKLISELVSGKTAVWLLVESSDRLLNDKSEKVLKDAIKQAKRTLRLPPKASLRGQGFREDNTVKYQLDFSVIRIKRSDMKDQVFAKMLSGVEAGLREDQYEQDQPLAILIYARGRTMFGALHPDTMNVDEALQNMSFAVDPPQDTTASEQHALEPSVDLLLSINWEGKIIVDLKQREIDVLKIKLKDQEEKAENQRYRIKELVEEKNTRDDTILKLTKELETAQLQKPAETEENSSSSQAEGKRFQKPSGFAFVLAIVVLVLLGFSALMTLSLGRD